MDFGNFALAADSISNFKFWFWYMEQTNNRKLSMAAN
jgi:hypothetical protein